MSTLSTSHHRRASGLGIDLCPSTRPSTIRSIAAPPSSLRTISSSSGSAATTAHGIAGSLRSISAMQGLLLAEVGLSMVEFDDPCSGGPGSAGFKEGQRIAHATPGGGSRRTRPNPHVEALRRMVSDEVQEAPDQSASLARHGTLLTAGAPPARNAAELKSILGNAHAKLKPKATVLPLPRSVSQGDVAGAVALEQAKPVARVSLDILLSNPACVQGSALSGHIKIRIRKSSALAKEEPVAVAGEGKVRVVGFESIHHNGAEERFVFYQTGGRLKVQTGSVWKEGETGDDEGFGLAREGVHVLPFRLPLPLEGKDGDAKGSLNVHGGVMVRYIAMASIKIKDVRTCKRSIAHFYRTVFIYPRLDPSLLLVPAPRPLQTSASKSFFLGGAGKLHLTALLHRLHFIAGQRCYVRLRVSNETKKTVRSASLALVRKTVVFRPRPHLDVGAAGDPDACETVTMVKVVAESTLEMGDKSAKGHASARGWWTGVGSGEKAAFEHFILLPAEALSVSRGRLLEVEYSIRVSLSAGTLGSVVQVALPVRIVNFLSVDPPHSWSHESDFRTVSSPEKPRRGSGVIHAEDIFAPQDANGRPSRMLLESLPEEAKEGEQQGSPSPLKSPYEDDSPTFGEAAEMSYQYDGRDDGDCLAYAEDSISEDEEGQQERPASFADLYHASLQEEAQKWERPQTGSSSHGVEGSAAIADRSCADSLDQEHRGGDFPTVSGGGPVRLQTTFAMRVQEKKHQHQENGGAGLSEEERRHEQGPPQKRVGLEEEVEAHDCADQGGEGSKFSVLREAQSPCPSALSERLTNTEVEDNDGCGSRLGDGSMEGASLRSVMDYVNAGAAEFHEEGSVEVEEGAASAAVMNTGGRRGTGDGRGERESIMASVRPRRPEKMGSFGSVKERVKWLEQSFLV